MRPNRLQTLFVLTVCLALAFSAMTFTAALGQSYRRLTVISLPNVPPKTGNFTYDIGWVDPGTHRYFLADRTNNGIDVIDTTTNTYLKTLAAGKFEGWKGKPALSGPNGILVVPAGHELWAGEANGLVKVIDQVSGSIAATVSVGGSKRADELAYDARDHLILIASPNDDPPFLSFISTTTRKVKGKIVYPDADGLEQPVWDPISGMFFQSVPATKAHPGGEVDKIDPKTMKVVAVYPVTDCNPAGLALGPQQHLALGCSGDAIDAGARAQTIIMDAKDGHIVATITQVGGSDAVAYNPGDNRYYLAARDMTSNGRKDGAKTPVLGIIDAGTNRWIANLPTGPNAHSVAVDPGTNRVYVPIPSGIAVFGQ